MPELAVHSAARMPKVSLPLPEDRVISVMTCRISSNAEPGSAQVPKQQDGQLSVGFEDETEQGRDEDDAGKHRKEKEIGEFGCKVINTVFIGRSPDSLEECRGR
jgi:hypothetical protein